MKYSHSKVESTEYLRLALPLMSRQEAALHPIAYAVWYEYVAGANAALKRCVDDLSRRLGKLTEDATEQVFREHIVGAEERALQRVDEGIQRVMTGIADSAAQAGAGADNLTHAIDQWVGALEPGQRELGVEDPLGAVLRGTREMQSAMSSLKENLEASSAEIHALRAEIDRTRQEALSDGLTGLANRRAFDRALADCVAQHRPEQVGSCLLMIDVDHFKHVNDTFGHPFGDRVLRNLAMLLKANTKGRDLVCRFGGEEFAIILHETPLEGARSLAEELRATVQNSRIKRADNGNTVEKITISIGVARLRDGEPGAEFLRRVDAALYESKNEGRNRVTVAS